MDGSPTPTIARPDTIEDLVHEIERARRERRGVLAIGRARATSDVARPAPDGALIALDRLRIDPAPWRLRGDLGSSEPRIVRGLGLARVAASATVREVLDALEREGRTLASIPSDLEGTIAGTVTTGGHGTGMWAGPLADSVAAIEMVAALHGAVRPVRIEPRDGVGSARGDLIHDDDLFRSASVSLGTMGAFTSLTLVTVPAFALEETRELVPWSTLREVFAARARSEDFFELAILPGGLCLVRSRARTDARETEIAKVAGAGRALFEAAASRTIRGPAAHVLSAAIGDPFAISTEVVVGVDRAVAAIDTALALPWERWSHGAARPIVVRTSRASRAYLAMQHGHVSVSIEAGVGSEGEGDGELRALTAFERALIDPRIGGRPHWGKRHTIAGGFVDHYPGAAKWRAARARLDPDGIFRSAFGHRARLTR